MKMGLCTPCYTISDLEDDDGALIYEDGNWKWDKEHEALVFISKNVEEKEGPLQVLVNTTFKQDIDVIEQQKYERRYQRKSAEDNDVVRLQDIKDIVIYSAPLTLLSKFLINVLHQRPMERLLRALILYIQYFLQVKFELEQRALNAVDKIRTERTDKIESILRENLHDLRLLIAKEYSVLILGGNGYRNYHHLGPDKRRVSLTKADELFYEGFIRISVEIVYIALGRKFYKEINLEVNRLFRSETFNLEERAYKSNTSLNKAHGDVFAGCCLQQRRFLNEHSPLYDECRCSRDKDFKTLGIGVIQYSKLNKRQIYFERALTLPEIELHKYNMSLGIIGLERRRFDVMLKNVKEHCNDSKLYSNTSIHSVARKIHTPPPSRITLQKEASIAHVKSSSVLHPSPRASCLSLWPPKTLYPNIDLPPSTQSGVIPEAFPEKRHPANRSGWCYDSQRIKWIARLNRLNKISNKGKKTSDWLVHLNSSSYLLSTYKWK